MHMSVNEAPEMHDIPLSVDEPNASVRSSMKTKYNSLRGLFKLPNKKKPKAGEEFAVGEAPELTNENLKSESVLAGCYKKEQHTDHLVSQQDMTDTSSAHKPLKQSLKKSISTYWNNVFKRSQACHGVSSKVNLAEKLNENDEYVRKKLSEDGDPMSTILAAVGQKHDSSDDQDARQARNSIDEDGGKIGNDYVVSETDVASCFKSKQLGDADISSSHPHLQDENSAQMVASTSPSYKSTKKTIKSSISANWNSIFKRRQHFSSNEVDNNLPPGEKGDGHDENEMRCRSAAFKSNQLDLEKKREEEYDGDDENEFCPQSRSFKTNQTDLEKQPDDEYDGDDEKDLNDEKILKSTNLQNAEDDDNSVDESA